MMTSLHMKGGTLLIVVVFLLGGCASKYAPQTTQVTYYPQCYSPLGEVREAETETGSSVAAGAFLGALLGAAGGLLASGGKAEGAAIGAVAGAGVGGMVGASSARQAEKKRLAHYMNELDGDIRGLNDVTAAGRLSIQCYDRAFKTALQAFKTGRMTRRELDSRYAEIKAGSAEATSFMGVALNQANQKDAQYQAALNEAAQEANRPVPVIAASPAANKQVASTQKKQTKQTTRKQTPSKASAAAKAAPVVSTDRSSDELTHMAQQTTTLAQSRQELQNEVSEASALQESWAADLAAIRS